VGGVNALRFQNHTFILSALLDSKDFFIHRMTNLGMNSKILVLVQELQDNRN
jgi:hypothetical protein